MFGISVIVFALLMPSLLGFTCKDEHNNSVDWFYAYKLPVSYADGLHFLYMTASAQLWRLSNATIDQADSIIGHTISQAFLTQDNDADHMIMAYNDEPPQEKADGINGHTKGLLMSDSANGFWLIHSVPLFPTLTELPSDYTYPHSGRSYGQSFLCISVNSSEIEPIAGQLLYNEPHVYDFKISDNLKSMFPTILRVAAKEKIKELPFWNLRNITSIGGTWFTSFAKSRHFERELYDDWVAPVLNENLLVETWRHGTGNLPSDCRKGHRVLNVSKLKMEIIDFELATSDDHSKWAVSLKPGNWTCVGDINRAEHQKRRAGGTVCMLSPIVAQAYQLLVREFEPCPGS